MSQQSQDGRSGQGASQSGPPAAEAASVSPAVQIRDLNSVAIPTTKEEVLAIRAQRAELSDQLISAQRRFREWMRDLDDAPVVARDEIQGNLAVLANRIQQLENDIAYTGRQLSLTREDLLTSTAPPPEHFLNIPPEDLTRMVGIFSLLVLFPLAIAFARLLWKRATSPRTVTIQNDEVGQRLKRVEQAVDAVAIEVERISEGQRFLTHLFTRDESKELLGAGKDGESAIR